MRLLANENIAGSVVRRIRQAGHDVLWVREAMLGAEDGVVLARAMAERRVALTFDKDFGELAFRSLLPASCGVILLRLTPKGRESDIQRIVAAVLSRDDWTGAFWVIANDGVRRRALPESAS